MSIKLPNDCDRAGDATPLPPVLLLTAVGRLEDHIVSEEAAGEGIEADVAAANDDVVVGVGPPGIVSTTVGPPSSLLLLLFNRLSIEALLGAPISIGVALQLHLLLIVGIGPVVTVGVVVLFAPVTIAVVVVVGVNCPAVTGPLQLPFSKHPHRGGAIVTNSVPTVEAGMVGVGVTVAIATNSSTLPIASVAPAARTVSPPLVVGQSSSGDVSFGSIFNMRIVIVVTEPTPAPSPLGGSCSLCPVLVSTPTRC